MSCRYHLYADVQKNGRLVINSPVEPDMMAETCALDVAERGGMTLREIGRMLGITKERVRQINDEAMTQLAHRVECDGTPIPQPPEAPTSSPADEMAEAAEILGLSTDNAWLSWEPDAEASQA